jgi:hypothetical protein
MKIVKEVPMEVQRWAKMIALRNADEMTDLYDDNAVLMATFEPMLVGEDAIEGYFKKFLDKEGLQCKIHENDTHVDFDADVFVANGLYSFKYTEDGQTKIVRARYTFVIQEGFIVAHHSSEMPKT